MFKATELFEHMQRYTREVFAERLQKEGFSSYKGQDIHWYRLVNNEVVQAVYFVAYNAAPCSFAEIRYGCHPLFVDSVLQKSPLMSGLSDYVQISNLIPETIPGSTICGVERLLLYSEFNNRPFRVPDILIMCAPNQNYGLDILEKLLSVLNRTTTTLACYELHKELCRQLASPDFRIRSTYFVDEALYLHDEEMYSFCREFVKSEAGRLEHITKKGYPIPRMYKQSWQQSSVLNQVFDNGAYEEYLHTLQDRAQHNLRKLERLAGICKSI